jgi:hypothetical protein
VVEANRPGRCDDVAVEPDFLDDVGLLRWGAVAFPRCRASAVPDVCIGQPVRRDHVEQIEPCSAVVKDHVCGDGSPRLVSEGETRRPVISPRIGEVIPEMLLHVPTRFHSGMACIGIRSPQRRVSTVEFERRLCLPAWLAYSYL